MNKTTSSRQGKPAFSVYWPGTNIVKSTGNGFTIPPHSGFVDQAEKCKATKHAKNLDNSHEAQKARDGGFAHATLGGLSKRAQKQLKKPHRSISVSKRGSSRSDQIKRGGI